MNNAAMNETAALWHDFVENYRHATAILLGMCVPDSTKGDVT